MDHEPGTGDSEWNILDIKLVELVLKGSVGNYIIINVAQVVSLNSYFIGENCSCRIDFNLVVGCLKAR